MQLHPAAERGRTRIDWLDSRHSFSFGGWFHPQKMGFRGLRVINDDRVAGGGGFGAHGHRDMEIVSVVVEGALAHRDSLGTGSVIRAGDVQRMSAGTGVRHSEMNPSPDEPVRFLQIWLPPTRRGTPPSYVQRHFPLEDRQDRLVRLVDPDGTDGAVSIGADAILWGSVLGSGAEVVHEVATGRHAWVQVVRGRVEIGPFALSEGDGLEVSAPGPLTVRGLDPSSELLIFDLP